MSSITKIGEPKDYFNKMVLIETDECILWLFAKNGAGYGNLRIDGKSKRVSRLALAYHNGGSPKHKTLALHKPLICHNPACFNYRHLYWGSPKDNWRDTTLDGTSNRGETNGKAKFSANQIVRIFNDGRGCKVIAKEWGVSLRTIYKIKSGERWGWLTNASY